MNDANRFRFRGISTLTGEWVYGTVLTDFLNMYPIETGHMWIWSTDYGWIEVDPKTAGQSTGLTYKNGAEMFEGDIMQGSDTSPKYVVGFEHGQWKGRYRHLGNGGAMAIYGRQHMFTWRAKFYI